jgi:hypothetical protein
MKRIQNKKEAFDTELAEALDIAIAQASDTIMTYFLLNELGTEQAGHKIGAGHNCERKSGEGNQRENQSHYC